MSERLKAYQELVASRGLTVQRFDGHTLFLKYDPQHDDALKERPVDGSELSLHAIKAMNQQLSGPELFPGIKKVTVDLS